MRCEGWGPTGSLGMQGGSHGVSGTGGGRTGAEERPELTAHESRGREGRSALGPAGAMCTHARALGWPSTGGEAVDGMTQGTRRGKREATGGRERWRVRGGNVGESSRLRARRSRGRGGRSGRARTTRGRDVETRLTAPARCSARAHSAIAPLLAAATGCKGVMSHVTVGSQGRQVSHVRMGSNGRVGSRRRVGSHGQLTARLLEWQGTKQRSLP